MFLQSNLIQYTSYFQRYASCSYKMPYAFPILWKWIFSVATSINLENWYVKTLTLKAINYSKLGEKRQPLFCFLCYILLGFLHVPCFRNFHLVPAYTAKLRCGFNKIVSQRKKKNHLFNQPFITYLCLSNWRVRYGRGSEIWLSEHQKSKKIRTWKVKKDQNSESQKDQNFNKLH